MTYNVCSTKTILNYSSLDLERLLVEHGVLEQVPYVHLFFEWDCDSD